MSGITLTKLYRLLDRFRASVLVAAVALIGAYTAPAVAQPKAGVQYETRIFLPSAVAPLGVDEAVFLWELNDGFVATDPDGDGKFLTVTADQLKTLQLKVDTFDFSLGDVFIDNIIWNGDVQAAAGRDFQDQDDVIWDFEFFDPLDANYDNLVTKFGPGEPLAFRNIIEPTVGAGDVFFRVAGDLNADSIYDVQTYPVPAGPGSPGSDKSWELAKTYAELQTRKGIAGHLATITSLAEDQIIRQAVIDAYGGQAWVGASKDISACPDDSEPDLKKRGWKWVNNEGCLSANSYINWAEEEGEPNDADGVEDWMAVNRYPVLGWNDDGSAGGIALIGSFVIEYSDLVSVTRFKGEAGNQGPVVSEVSASESALMQRTAIVSTVTVRNIPTPVGEGTIFDIPTVEQEGLVVAPGLTNVDVCVAPDPREGFIIQGQGRQFKGKGKGIGLGTDERQVTRVFNRTPLSVSDLAGSGTCEGELPNVDPDDQFQTWEDLLGVVDLIYPADYRGFVGRVDLTPETLNDEADWVEAVWFMVVVVRSTAQFAGPVSVVSFPEELINYDLTPVGQRPVDFVNDQEALISACANELGWRPIDLAGNVLAFDGTVDVEDSLIPKTVQCNRSWSLTRRSTHVVPGRLETEVNYSAPEEIENANIAAQFTGLQDTLLEAGAICSAIPAGLYNQLQFFLDQAETAFVNGVYVDETYGNGAVDYLEDFAELALVEGPSGDNPGTGFDSCPIVDNVPGNLVARSLTAAFTVHDRFVYNGIDNPYSKYEPEILTELTPDLREEGEAVPPPPPPPVVE